MAPGGGVVPAARGQVRPPGELAGLQVGGAELRAAHDDVAGGRGDRGGRLRLPDRPLLPAPLRAGVRRPVDRVRAGAAGLPRLAAGPLLPAAVLLVQVLLRGLAAVAQRARRGHLRRHHGPDPPGGAGRARRLGRVVHHRGRRAVAAAAAGGVARPARGPDLGPRDHAADVRGAQGPALPVVLRRHPDPAHALALAAARPPRAGQPPVAGPGWAYLAGALQWYGDLLGLLFLIFLLAGAFNLATGGGQLFRTLTVFLVSAVPVLVR